MAETSKPSPFVLVVDDDYDNRVIYSAGLRFAGFRVEAVGDAATALRRARDGQPSAIVMDLSMPVVDGFEAIRRLRRDVKTRRIGVVALTAFTSSENRARAKQAGADFFVSKPCTPMELSVHIFECMRRRGFEVAPDR
jgi:two-component system, cell cycle response regulator DivK